MRAEGWGEGLERSDSSIQTRLFKKNSFLRLLRSSPISNMISSRFARNHLSRRSAPTFFALSLMLSYDLVYTPVSAFLDYESLLLSSTTPSRYPHLLVDTLTGSTFDKDVTLAIRADIPWLLAALGMVVVWLAMSFGRGRTLLACSALLTTVLSLSVALGVQAVMGWKICR